MARDIGRALGRVPRGQVVDFHVHAFPPEVVAHREQFAARDAGFATLYASPRARIATGETVLAQMAEAGVSHSVLMGFGWADAGLCREHTAYLCELSRRYTDRLTAFAAAQPADPNVAADLAEAAALGARGVGELMPHLQGYSLEAEAATAAFAEAAVALDLVVVTHTSEPVGHVYPGKGDVHPRALLAFASRWPRLRLVAAHLGGGLPFYELMPEVAEATRNVWYDTAASPLLYSRSVYDRVVDIIGSRRLLYGSDFPLLGQARCIRRIRESGLGPGDLEWVLGENARALLGCAGEEA